MSIRTLALPAALLCALALQPALAADPAETTASGQPMQAPMTLEQANQRAASKAAAMDTNKDGVIDAEEFTAWHERQRAQRMQRRLNRYDTDGDGVVTVEEFTAAHKARMATMDTDGDGVISADEFRAGHRKMQRNRMMRGDGMMQKDGMMHRHGGPHRRQQKADTPAIRND